ncbi:MAG TPA: hypothetical protein VEZ52_08110 [Desulfovibrio sp.]|uniref:hypothetical protein n=1 Tax=Desulfovibrio sp. TaxID=885 RepID=UPI002D2F2176|nr:hypothetical protein [Desulfovibrio sp.]HZF61568.1 hypothetical protein [Desulfovibrio sp.]
MLGFTLSPLEHLTLEIPAAGKACLRAFRARIFRKILAEQLTRFISKLLLRQGVKCLAVVTARLEARFGKTTPRPQEYTLVFRVRGAGKPAPSGLVYIECLHVGADFFSAHAEQPGL